MSSADLSDVVIALVGRPNVGKSTLFNVLTKSRDALVADYPGLTRDRKYGRFEYECSNYIIIDTGGLSGESEEIDSHMAKQTRFAIDESDVVLFMVDGRAGLTPEDEVISESLRRTGKQVNLIVNKTDGLDSRSVSSEFYSLGLGEPICIASSQNRGIQSMLATVLKKYRTNNDTVLNGDDSDIEVEHDEEAPADNLHSSAEDSGEETSDENIKIGRAHV